MQNKNKKDTKNVREKDVSPKNIGRESYKFKRSPAMDVFAGVLSVLLACTVWYFFG